jgi:hypothetical protein
METKIKIGDTFQNFRVDPSYINYYTVVNNYYLGCEETLDCDKRSSLADFINFIKNKIYKLDILRDGYFYDPVYIPVYIIEDRKYILTFYLREHILKIEILESYPYHINSDVFHKSLTEFLQKIDGNYRRYTLFSYFNSSFGPSYWDYDDLYAILPKNVLEQWLKQYPQKLCITVDPFYLKLAQPIDICTIFGNVSSIELYLDENIIVDEIFDDFLFAEVLNNILQTENIAVEMLYPEKAVMIVECNYNEVFNIVNMETILEPENDAELDKASLPELDENSFFVRLTIPKAKIIKWNTEIRCFWLVIEANMRINKNLKFMIYDKKEHKLLIPNLISNFLLTLGILEKYSEAIMRVKINDENGFINMPTNIFTNYLNLSLKKSIKDISENMS